MPDRRGAGGPRSATDGAAFVAALMAGSPARAVQALHGGPHIVADHSMSAMLWSMVVLVGVAAALVAIAGLWHWRGQGKPPGSPSGD